MTEQASHPAASTGDFEPQLRALFATLLEREPDTVANDDDFFELGGDSLLVIKLVARIRRTLGVELTPGDVFDHPTPGGLSRHLQGA